MEVEASLYLPSILESPLLSRIINVDESTISIHGEGCAVYYSLMETIKNEIEIRYIKKENTSD